MIRIPIGGCDFDFAPWAYNEYPMHDANLSNFEKLDERDRKRVRIDITNVKFVAFVKLCDL